MRVLYVEDSLSLRETVADALRRSGYAVDVTAEGREGAQLGLAEPYDVAVLDVMVPGLDGFGIVDEWRKAGRDLPVLFLTARTAVTDRVDGLNRGGDDYLTKPFALEELLARVQALCRRRYGQTSPQLSIGILNLNTVAKTVRCGDNHLTLTPREYALLEYLAFRAGEVVSRTEIEAHIYDDLAEPMSNVVNSAICLLRSKLDSAGATGVITTRRGLGYVLEEVP